MTGTSNPFSIVGISMIKNESDILETFIRHNLNYVDCFIIIENNSTDASTAILHSLISEGLPICVIDDPVMGYFQSEKISNLLCRVNSAFFADFVIPLDADELIQAGDREEFTELLSQIPDPGIGYMPWVTYIPGPETAEKNLLPGEFQYRRKVEEPQYNKVIIRTGGRPLTDISINQGAHEVTCPSMNLPKLKTEKVCLAHFPIRGKRQTSGKVLLGWLAYLAKDRNAADSRVGYHWQHLYNKITMEGGEISNQDLTEIALNYAQTQKSGEWQDHVEAGSPIVLGDAPRYDSETGNNLLSLIVSSWARRIAPEPAAISKNDLQRFSSNSEATAQKDTGAFENDWHIKNLFVDVQPFKYLSLRLNPDSVLDVGCGIGQYLKLFKQFGASEVFGIDGFIPEFSFLQNSEYREHDLTQSLDLGSQFDLVVCLEVAEHLPPGTEAHLLGLLETHSKDFLLFSAAEIGQGGHGHINCRPLEFWADMFITRGWAPLLFETLAFRSISTMSWFRRNPILLTRQPMDEDMKTRGWEKLIAISRMSYEWYAQQPCIVHEPLRYAPPGAYQQAARPPVSGQYSQDP